MQGTIDPVRSAISPRTIASGNRGRNASPWPAWADAKAIAERATATTFSSPKCFSSPPEEKLLGERGHHHRRHHHERRRDQVAAAVEEVHDRVVVLHEGIERRRHHQQRKDDETQRPAGDRQIVPQPAAWKPERRPIGTAKLQPRDPRQHRPQRQHRVADEPVDHRPRLGHPAGHQRGGQQIADHNHRHVTGLPWNERVGPRCHERLAPHQPAPHECRRPEKAGKRRGKHQRLWPGILDVGNHAVAHRLTRTRAA